MATIEPLLRTDFKTVDKRDEVRNVLGWLSGDSDTVPIVVDGDTPVGIVNERALMSRRLDQKAHIDQFTLTTRALPWNASLEDAAARMREFRAAHLPVQDKRGKVIGYVASVDVARAQNLERTAADLCLPVRSLNEAHTMGDALHAFTQEYVDILPVMDGGGRVTGVLPRRALLRMELGTGGHSRGRRDAGGEKINILDDAVSGFMDEAPVVLPAAASWERLLDTIEESGYAIVQKDGAKGGILGVITPETLMRAGPTPK